MGILITYLRWYSAITKREDINRNVLNYKAPLQPWLAIYALVMVLCILLFAGCTSHGTCIVTICSHRTQGLCS